MTEKRRLSDGAIVLRCAGMADGTPGPEGFLAEYDPATGVSEWSPDRSKALRFSDVGEAHSFWTQVHPTEPVRPWDGRPNRPLTAFSVSMEPA